ncbi:hypothetical protein HDV01_007249 [Terramyces sp. JEL0728]|nr:hypothetical protein HDV01_007249 [Terramyces sp. JEL0728]
MESAIHDFETLMTSSLDSDISIEIGRLMNEPEMKELPVEGERVALLENALDILLEKSFLNETDKSTNLSNKLSSINSELESLKSQIDQPEVIKERQSFQSITNPESKLHKDGIKTPIPTSEISRTTDKNASNFNTKDISDRAKTMQRDENSKSIDIIQRIESTREILKEKQKESAIDLEHKAVFDDSSFQSEKVAITTEQLTENSQKQSGTAVDSESDSSAPKFGIEHEPKPYGTNSTNTSNGNATQTPDNFQTDSSPSKHIPESCGEDGITSREPRLKAQDNSNTNHFSRSRMNSKGSLESKQRKPNLSVLPQFPYQEHSFKNKPEPETKSILKHSIGAQDAPDTAGGLTPQIKDFIRTEIQLHLQSFVRHQFPGILQKQLEKFETKLMDKIAAKQVKWDLDDSVSHTSTVSTGNLINLQNEMDLNDSNPGTPTISDYLSSDYTLLPSYTATSHTATDIKQDQISSESKGLYKEKNNRSNSGIPSQTPNNTYDMVNTEPAKVATVKPHSPSSPNTHDTQKQIPRVVHREAVDVPDTEENAERLLKLLRNKLNYKAKIIKQLEDEKMPKPKSPRSDHFLKPTLASQLKRKAFYS